MTSKFKLKKRGGGTSAPSLRTAAVSAMRSFMAERHDHSVSSITVSPPAHPVMRGFEGSLTRIEKMRGEHPHEYNRRSRANRARGALSVLQIKARSQLLLLYLQARSLCHMPINVTSYSRHVAQNVQIQTKMTVCSPFKPPIACTASQ
jgi:hypothetical protein